jgi:N-acetylmuramic acid 6-phosphate (MurNAc-6-P) etherase
MTEIELIEKQLGIIDNSTNLAFETAEKMFQDRDKDVVTPTLVLLTSMGGHIAAFKILHNKLKTQIEVLKDLVEDEKSEEAKETKL